MKSFRFLSILAGFALAFPFGFPLHGRADDGDPTADILPTISLPKVESTDTKEVMARVGERVVVSGDVADTREWDGGITFIDFRNSEFVAVCFQGDYGRFGTPRPADRFRGHRLQIVGIIALHKGSPQIRLESPSQIVSSTPLTPENAGD